MDIPIEFIRSGWRIGNSDRDHRHLVQNIEQVIPPIRPHGDVWRVKAHLPFRVEGILGFSVYYALVFPTRQVIHGRGPTNIIPQTEYMSIVEIMRTVNIDSVPENMRLAIRDIFP
jgi:hypothetical protein